MADLSTQEAEDLYQCQKWILEDVTWREMGKFLKLDVPVHTQLNETLTLRGQYRNRYSFCLLYRNNIPVRRWDYAHRGTEKKIKNSDGETVRVVSIPNQTGHKHRWDEDLEDRDIYAVDDIPLNDVNEAFHAFLDESRIELKGAYDPIF